MSLFNIHKCEYELVSTIYAPPIGPVSSLKGLSEQNFMQLLSGVTTFLYKCKNAHCDSFLKQECLGKIVK